MKVGKLKELLKNIPDDLEIVGYESDMERSGIMPKSFNGKILKVKEEKENTWDSFDGTNYTYTRYRKDPNGDKEVFYM